MEVRAVDDRGREHSTGETPGRIVSLVPSTTETLYYLGCGDRMVGVTRFCVRPGEAGRLAKVGGTKDPSIERILALEPDIVIGNIEENSEKVLKEMEEHGLNVYAAFPRDVDEALHDLIRMGKAVGRQLEAELLCAQIQTARAAVQSKSFRYAYLIWRNPWMAAGGACFISAMLSEAGGTNIFAGEEAAYPEIDVARLSQADVVLLASEPFPFRERHKLELAMAAGIPVSRLRLIDGEMCSWHGARMADAFPYLSRLTRELP